MKSLIESIQTNESSLGKFSSGWIEMGFDDEAGVGVVHVRSNERMGTGYEVLVGKDLKSLGLPSAVYKAMDDGTGSIYDDPQDWYIRIF